MKAISGFLLGSTALIVGGTAASAADLPSRKAAPAEYVKVCDAYGAGYFYIPGTETCLRVGGYLRAEYMYAQSGAAQTTPSFKAASAAIAPATNAGFSTLVPAGLEDQTGFLARGRLELDARTQSPWGTARTFIAIRAQNTSGVYGDSNAAAATLTGQVGTTGLTVENAIVQFAGFTFGRTTGEIFAFLPGQDWAGFDHAFFPGGINLLSYTATFGGGFSSTIGVEDRAGLAYSNIPGYVGTANIAGALTPVGAAGAPGVAFAGGSASAVGGAVTNGPLTWPALTANVRLDQPWGAVQLMGQVLQNGVATNYANAVITAGSPNVALTQTGWAIGAGVKINLPMLAAGDALYATVAYAVGDLDELTQANTSATTNAGKELNGLQRFDRDLYLTPSSLSTSAACSAAGAGNLSSACWTTEQTKGWSAAAFFTHYWTPTLRSVFLASYLNLTPGSKVQNTDWTLGGLSAAQEFRLGAQLIWSPVKDLDIGGELSYKSLNASLANAPGVAATCTTPASGLGTAACNALGALSASSNIWEARIRISRQF